MDELHEQFVPRTKLVVLYYLETVLLFHENFFDLQIFTLFLFNFPSTRKWRLSKNNTIIELRVQFYIIYAPNEKLNMSFLITFYKLLRDVKSGAKQAKPVSKNSLHGTPWRS